MAKVTPTNIWEVSESGLSAVSFGETVYAAKADGRYGLTTDKSLNNASLVKDTATGDLHFIDSVNTGSGLRKVRGNLHIVSVALV
jgi:hypothetical protein